MPKPYESKPDLLEEELVPLRAVPAILPVRVHTSGPIRWADRGLKRGPHVVYLESLNIAGRRFTSRQALARFFARLNDPALLDRGSPPAAREPHVAGAADRADAIFGR